MGEPELVCVRTCQGLLLGELYKSKLEAMDIPVLLKYDAAGPVYGITVDGHVEGPDFVLPPQDDVVNDGDFESGNLAAWQAEGSAPPALSTTAHSGLAAVQLGAEGQDSSLAQVITPGSPLDGPTLSFMVRLAEAGPANSLDIRVAGTGVLSPPLTYTLPVESVDWTHVWHDMPGPVSEPLTLTLTVVDAPALVLDEVRLGTSLQSGFPLYLPILHRE